MTVFLGGACNPTTWRYDLAIPFLEENRITYYNPQVTEWQSDLIEKEEQAKHTAELLFFVVDTATRSTSSMIEAAYLTGSGRQLILVIIPFSEFPVIIAGESVNDAEYVELTRSRAFLANIAEKQGVPVFSEIPPGLNCVKAAVKSKISVLKNQTQPQAVWWKRIFGTCLKCKCSSTGFQPDVFLGGACYLKNWVEDIAKPMLKNAGISYSQDAESCQYMVENCLVVLFVISPLVIKDMIEAVYYISKGCDVVICTCSKNVLKDTFPHCEAVSARTMGDYKRAHSYFQDIVQRENIPMFENVDEAIRCCIEKIKV